jgi:hypothetical protein
MQWKETESRGAVVPLLREVGRPDVAHVSVWFDDEQRVLWSGIRWAPGTPAYERPGVAQRCVEALREWKGLGDYEPRVVTSPATGAGMPVKVPAPPASGRVREGRGSREP